MKKLSIFMSIICMLLLTSNLFGQRRFTSFDVKKHGFKFTNSFKTTVGTLGGIKVTFGGLCGGMAYAANDYFTYRKPIPSQDYLPQMKTPLHRYIFKRQVNSYASLDKYVELSSGLGLRDEEFFYWGLEKRLYQLKKRIDKNQPVPLGLYNVNNDPTGHHQVLAIGYDLGGYKGRRHRDPNKQRVRIYIYDPNYPNELCVLVPVPRKNYYLQFRTKRKGSLYIPVKPVRRKWRTYIVDENYRAKKPNVYIKPVSNKNKNLVQKLVFSIRTGSDDLRGGKDNVNIFIYFRNGTMKKVYKANKGHRWPDNHTENVVVWLDKPIAVKDIYRFKLKGTMSGGYNGDNWNLDRLIVNAYKGNGAKVNLCDKHNIKKNKYYTLKRFTGKSNQYAAVNIHYK